MKTSIIPTKVLKWFKHMKSVCDAKGWKYGISARIDNDKIKDYRYPIIFKSQTSKVLIRQTFRSLTFDNKLLEEDTGHFRRSSKMDISISSNWECLDNIVFSMLEKGPMKDLLKWYDFVPHKEPNTLVEKIASYQGMGSARSPRHWDADYIKKSNVSIVKLKSSNAHTWNGEISKEDDCKYCFAVIPCDLGQYSRIFLYDIEKWILTYHYRKRFVVVRPQKHEYLTFKDRAIINNIIKEQRLVIE